MTEQPSITCPVCLMTSYHPMDIRQGYCGNCHWWTSDDVLGSPEVLYEVSFLGIATFPQPLHRGT